MSLQSCIDDARAKGSYDGNVLVVFDGWKGRVLLTLEWDSFSERWGARCSDESRMFHALAPVGEPEVVAVTAALNAYLDCLNGRAPEVGSGNLWARGAVARATVQR